MAAQTRVRTRFVGRARAFRTRIEVADDATFAAISQASPTLVERMKRSPISRADTLAGTARAKRAEMPALDRLHQRIEHRQRILLRRPAAQCRPSPQIAIPGGFRDGQQCGRGAARMGRGVPRCDQDRLAPRLNKRRIFDNATRDNANHAT